jgi:hypothetical protein
MSYCEKTTKTAIFKLDFEMAVSLLRRINSSYYILFAEIQPFYVNLFVSVLAVLIVFMEHACLLAMQRQHSSYLAFSLVIHQKQFRELAGLCIHDKVKYTCQRNC